MVDTIGPTLYFASSQTPQITIRRARPDDAKKISSLYAIAYKPKDGGDARDHYPFPQFLSDEWVANAVTLDRICWVVCVQMGQIIGSAGALRNIGNTKDRVAEIFGLVISKDFRIRGLGSALLAHLCQELAANTNFIICESRTAVAGGWKIAKNCNLMPIGFEPFAHTTPAGSESMLMTGLVAPQAKLNRSPKLDISPGAYQLAASILRTFEAHPPSVNIASQSYPTENVSLNLLSTMLGSDILQYFPYQRTSDSLATEIQVVPNDSTGKQIFNNLDTDALHKCGVVGLKYLEGEDLIGQRYQRSYYAAMLNQNVLGAIYTVHDRVDQRSRILGLQSCVEGLQGLLIGHTVKYLEKLAGSDRQVIVINILASAVKLQNTLQQLGFVPTVYFPGIISRGDTREDSIQYTRLCNCHFDSGFSIADKLDWPNAGKTIETVKQGFNNIKRLAVL